ncbi:MAG: DHHA1 domain-containing protein [bacterium]|nr:DHHA1 domain-containing protein [bacterium]
MPAKDIFSRILDARNLSGDTKDSFLKPDYDQRHDPFLLPDMQVAVDRLVVAHDKQQPITIYGDYDIDGLTATTILLDSFEKFGFQNVDAFIPNRFVEGYGLTVDAVERIAADGAELIITVDCGSLSEAEIIRANELGVDVIVTDHHNVAPVQPPAVAVINPKRLLQDYPDMYEDYILVPSTGTGPSVAPISSTTVSAPESRDRSRESDAAQPARVSGDETDTIDASASAAPARVARGGAAPSSTLVIQGEEGADRATGPATSDLSADSARISHDGSGDSNTGPSYPKLYPFLDLAGCGVAFKLVQALQTRLDGLSKGQEKWLLDLVALGTVCDIVTLVDENRTNVFYGLKVLSQTRRPGLKALMAVAGVEPHQVTARHLGFGLGPRMNASGRLETAQYSLDMLRATDGMEALQAARKLDDMNRDRRAQQDKIFAEAKVQAEQLLDDPVLVVSGKNWSHGIIGIVAAKLLEKYKKPTYVLEEMGDEAKGSARSYGDFSVADAIRASESVITKGGGHKFAAGVTLPTQNIQAFRDSVNNFYRQQKLVESEQRALLLPSADTWAEIADVTESLISEISQLEPFGSGNPQPILKSENLLVKNIRRMGDEGQHVKLTLASSAKTMDFLAFNAPENFFAQPGETVSVWYQPDINEWRGRRSVEGRLLHLEITRA